MPRTRTLAGFWLPSLVVTLAALHGAGAWAGVDWSFSSTPDGAGIVLSKKGSALTIHGQPPQDHSGNQGIVGAVLTLAEGIQNDEFVNQNYQLLLTLIDRNGPTPASTVLPFTGSISATITNGLASSWDHKFLGPSSYANVPLGDNFYNVSLGAFQGPDSAGVPGRIGFEVSVRAEGGPDTPPPTHATPEPGALMLTVSGALILGVRAWRQAR